MKRLDEVFLEMERRAADLERNLQSVVAQLRDMGAIKIVAFGSPGKDEAG